MTSACEQLRTTLRAAARGDYEHIAPETIAQLEAHLNQCAVCAAALAEQRCVADDGGDPVIGAARRAAPRISPSDAEALWGRIHRAAPAVSHSWVLRRLRRLAPLAVAAACVLMVNLWTNVRGTPAHPWKFEAAGWVEVDGVEVFDDHSGIFVSSGGNGTLPFIWVIDESGDGS